MHPRFPVAVHVLVLRGETILLLRRFNTGYEDGKLSVVAGHVEPGETVTQAAMRESREEVGLDLSADRLRVVGVMHRKSEDERTALPGDTIPYVRAAIENFRAGRWFQEFGWSGEAER